MATVDSLDIQISAEVKKASASIDSLVKKVDRLSASLSGVNTRGLATLGSGVNKLSNAMSNFSKNTKISDFTRLANSLKQLNGVNVQSLNSISPAIQNIANSMNAIGGLNFGNNAKQVASMVKALGSLNKINPSSIKNATNAIGKMAGAMNGIKGMNFGDNPTKIAELARSISNLGGKSATNAIKNIPLLASAMRNLMQTLSTAPKVSNNLIQMTNALAKFAKTGSSGGRAANVLSNSVSSMASRFNSMPRTFNMFNKSISSSILSMNGLRSSLSSIMRTYLGFYAIMRGLKNSIDISSDITEVQNVVDVTFGKYAKKVEELSKTSIQDFGMSELTVKQVASRFQAMGTAMGYSQKNMSDMSVELTKLTADMASFYNVEQKDVAEDLESIFTGQTRPLRAYGLDLTQATLQEWAMKQGMDANMKSMSQMQKTMLRYQYVMANSKQAQGDFIRTQNTWANQIRILKENFKEFQKVIGNILINTLKPLVKAFNLAMLEITAFSETVMNALGKIFGWTYEKGGGSKNPASDMADSMEDVVGATEDATKAQKEFNKQLGTFDELNNYTTNETGGGSGDGGGSGTGVDLTGGENGEWKQKDSVFKKFQSEINSLYELGSHIGETLSSAMLSIDWDSVYQKASNFGTGLANFLNGLISPKLFGATGTTIANALNTALTSLNSFGETFDWVNFGNSIANGINNFFKNFDFKLLAETLNTWVDGIKNAIIVAVEKTNWAMIWDKIKEFLKELDVDTGILLAIFASPALISGIGKVVALISKLTPIVSAVFGAFSSLSSAVSALGTALAALSAPVLAVIAVAASLVVGLGAVLATNKSVRTEFVNNVNTIKKSLKPAFELISKTVIPDLKTAFNTIVTTLSPIGAFISDTFTKIWTDMLNPALAYIGETIIPTLTSTFTNLWNNVLVPFGTFLSEVWSPIIALVSSALSALRDNIIIPLAKSFGSVLKTSFENTAIVINKTVIPVINALIKVSSTIWKKGFKPIAKNLSDVFKPVVNQTFTSIKNTINGIKNTLNGIIEFVSGVFTLNWSKAWKGAKKAFKGIWTTLKTVLTTPINGVIALFEGMINKVLDGWNFLIRSLNKFSIDMPDWVPAIGGKKFGIEIKEVSKVSIPRFEMGGFPEDGWFRASKGEYFGQFDDGTSYIANNRQIENGIASQVGGAVRNANMEQNMLLREQNELLRQILAKETGISADDVFGAVRNKDSDFRKRTGHSAFAY